MITNLYKIQEFPLLKEILLNFYKSYFDYFLSNEVFMNSGDSRLSKIVVCIFYNDL